MAGSQGWAGPSFRSRSCGEGTHDDCGHLGVMVRAAGRRGHRPVVLCGCGCHSACPLMHGGLVPQAAWEQRCTCPGTEEARRKLGEAGQERGAFAEFRKRSRRERQERQAARAGAFDAARAAAEGKTHEQARELYQAELRARGLPVPPDEVLNAYAAAIAGNRHLTPLSFLGLLSAGMGKELGELGKIFRNVRVFRDDG